MQMTLAEAQAEYAETQKKLLRLEGYITALKEMATEGAEQSVSPPTKLKAVGS
jgi:hypothetical protein